MEFRRLSLTVPVLLVMACDPASERESTLPGRSADANPTPSSTESDPGWETGTPVTAEQLFQRVIQRARSMASAPYTPASDETSPVLARLDYDQYTSIRFRPESAIWRGESPFELQLFHPGFVYRDPVRVHLLEEESLSTLPFDPGLFTYDGEAESVAALVSPELGYAGLRVHYPLNDPAIKDEVVAFLGTSYFRLLGAGHVYGLSSRGLAVDIATDREEEFPAFREFWVERPTNGASALTLFALLDGPSVTGAFRFDLEPGGKTSMLVDARLFAREDVGKLGVAPLSSMFLYGQNRTPAFDDFRPEVHDSDGLMMRTRRDEWIWRPLSNGPGLQVTSLRDENPRGFGLVQRERDFDSYLDLEANYHRRPSEWVEIHEGDWGSGGVELLVIPTGSEFNDNIAAYWVPDEPMMAGDERRYRYSLVTFDDRLEEQTRAQVERTRIGRDALPGEADPPPPSQRHIIVDFTRGAVRPTGGEGGRGGDGGRGGRGGQGGQPGHVEPFAETSAGEISQLIVQDLPNRGGWRASFTLTPDGRRPSDMRLYLESDGERLTETWSYVWYPNRVR